MSTYAYYSTVYPALRELASLWATPEIELPTDGDVGEEPAEPQPDED